MKNIVTLQLSLTNLLFKETRTSWFWFLIRLYIGWQWLIAGWAKLTSNGWIGLEAGAPIIGFLNNSLQKTGGAHPDVQGWYAFFVTHAVLPFPVLWSHIITFGELLVGVGLILGAFTGVAAFFGVFMNLNYLFAGTVSTNPILLVLGLGIMLAWRIAGYIGLDYYLLPLLGYPRKAKELSSV